jgi:hypothetical protein
VVGGPAAVFGADVPFAETGCGVADLGEDVAHRAFPGDEAAVVSAQRDGVVAGADGVSAGHQRRSRRRALRFDDVVRKFQALLGEPVDAFGVGAAQDAAAEAPELTQAEIVDVEKDDVGSVGH